MDDLNARYSVMATINSASANFVAVCDQTCAYCSLFILTTSAVYHRKDVDQTCTLRYRNILLEQATYPPVFVRKDQTKTRMSRRDKFFYKIVKRKLRKSLLFRYLLFLLFVALFRYYAKRLINSQRYLSLSLFEFVNF